MNFYVGNSIRETFGALVLGDDLYGACIEDSLVMYLYSINKKIPFKVFYNIDPYEHEEINKEDDIYDIINMCKYVLENNLLDNYSKDEDDMDFAVLNLNKLIKVSLEAIEKGKKLISIGD